MGKVTLTKSDAKQTTHTVGIMLASTDHQVSNA